MYNVIEYSNIYSEKSGILCQYYSYEQAIVINNNIIDFPANNNNNSNSIFWNLKNKRSNRNDDIKDVEIMVTLKI